jgi:hypothetical protein
VPPGLVVEPGGDGIPLFGEFEVGGAVVPEPGVDWVPGLVGAVPGVAVPGFGVAEFGLGVAAPGVGVAVPGFGVAVPGFVELPAGGWIVDDGPCVWTVPSAAMQGVLLPGAVVPGNVLGGLFGVPGLFWEFDGFGVMPGTDPEPLFTAEQGGRLPGLGLPVAGLL